MKELPIGNIIGLSLCSFVFIAMFPYAFENMGTSLENGILYAAITFSIMQGIMFYFGMKEQEDGE